MIVITGAAGFIGSCLATFLNLQGYKDLILVDDFSRTDKHKNFIQCQVRQLVERSVFFEWLQGKEKHIQFIIHLGARTDTTLQDKTTFEELNLQFSKNIWLACVQHYIPLIYASSAATYGKGEWGFDDDPQLLPRLAPQNAYACSKQQFDLWASTQKEQPFFWCGLKFFNVYGPNEYHKGRMASVIWHAFHQIKNTQKLKLFRSHHPDFRDGEQKRDFVYIKDVLSVIFHFMELRQHSGIYNLGTGQARSFLELAQIVFRNLELPPKIEFIDIPSDIRNSYQYYTAATTKRLRSTGYTAAFTSIEEGITEYIQEYLIPQRYYTPDFND
ncbi:MAG: ADP-glyceromanno-heptose 6-epimerase [Bacteroidia bacterium]|nr:ADP-glyceromanno-heptose 6-epimerase [Bacteroidia bacterium]MDW8158195.1 ADP-glyceromanno-heptose 6-epimerase [Bacteroidia bacterium]